MITKLIVSDFKRNIPFKTNLLGNVIYILGRRYSKFNFEISFCNSIQFFFKKKFMFYL